MPLRRASANISSGSRLPSTWMCSSHLGSCAIKVSVSCIGFVGAEFDGEFSFVPDAYFGGALGVLPSPACGPVNGGGSRPSSLPPLPPPHLPLPSPSPPPPSPPPLPPPRPCPPPPPPPPPPSPPPPPPPPP